MPPVEWPTADRLFEHLRPRPLLGSIIVAFAATVCACPIDIGALVLFDAEVVSLSTIVVFKAIYSAALAAVVTPVVVLLALAVTSSPGTDGLSHAQPAESCTAVPDNPAAVRQERKGLKERD